MDLSGGFRRRVQVAKVFMVETPVVFLDEFSTGMDPILKRSVMDKLRGEAAGGRTIVLTTQILSEAEELCDDILIINHGRAGGARRSAHAEAAVAGRLRRHGHLRSRCRRVSRRSWRRGSPSRLSIAQNTIEMTLKEDEPAASWRSSAALASRGRVLRLEVGGASLEDIFVELTQGRSRRERPSAR